MSDFFFVIKMNLFGGGENQEGGGNNQSGFSNPITSTFENVAIPVSDLSYCDYRIYDSLANIVSILAIHEFRN